MNSFEIKGRGGVTLQFEGRCIANVDALNHDDTVRCTLCLYKTKLDYVCHRIDRPNTIDQRFSFERCVNALEVYQFFGTEPLANYLYGMCGLYIPGIRKNNVQL